MRILMLLLLLSPLAMPAADLSDEQVLHALAADQPRDRAIRRALTWLRGQQQANGSIKTSENKNSTAITALAVMAHLAAGITFDDASHGPWMQRSLRYTLSMQSPNGYFGEKDGSRMYGHGIMTLMLAEALGMVGDADTERQLQGALERAVRVTEHAARVQKNDGRHAGGWRYEPNAAVSDLSLSGWQLMSLHACREVGIPIDSNVISEACAYADRLTTHDGKVGYDKAGQDRAGLRGISLMAFAIAGKEDDPKVDAIVDRIKRDPVRWKGSWLFYRMYYESVGMSRTRPEQWHTYRQVLEPVLIGHQHQDGWWPTQPGDNESRFGRAFTVCMAVLALTVERHVLPAYQR